MLATSSSSSSSSSSSQYDLRQRILKLSESEWKSNTDHLVDADIDMTTPTSRENLSQRVNIIRRQWKDHPTYWEESISVALENNGSIEKLIKDQEMKIANAATTAATTTYKHRGVCVSHLLCDDDENRKNKIITAAAITKATHKNKEKRRRLSLEQLQLNGYVSFAEGLARAKAKRRNKKRLEGFC